MNTLLAQPQTTALHGAAADPMPAVEDDSARPFLRRDTFYAEVDGGIQFASAGPAFQLAGRGAFQVFERIAPFLSGDVTRSELRAALGGHWALVETMLSHLNERGFLRWIGQSDVDALDEGDRTQYAEQIAFLAQYTDAPHATFARFRAAPLHLVGAGPLADSIVENLTANGHRRLSLVSTDQELDDDIRSAAHVLILPTADAYAWFDRNRAQLEAARCLLVLPSGDRLWVLPHTWEDTATPQPDWKDAVIALEAAGAMPALHATLISASEGFDPLTGRAAAVPVQRMLGAILSYEIFKGLTAVVPPETAVGAIALDVITGETTAHRVLTSSHRSRAALIPAAPPAAATQTVTEADSRAEDYDRWRALVGTLTMPIVGFDDSDLRQLPLKVGVGLDADGSRHRAASLWTLADARIEAITRGYERIVAGLEPAQSVCTLYDAADGTPSEIDAARVFRRSRANHAGAVERSDAAVAVALTPGEASRRAIHKAAAEYVLLENLREPGGQLIIGPAPSTAQIFLDEVAAETSGVSYAHLGVVTAPAIGALHVILAIAEEDGQVLWHAAAAPTQAAAVALAGTEVLSIAQFAAAQASTLSMRMWAGLDPRALITEGSDIRAHQVRVRTAEITAALLTSADLFAATAVIDDGQLR